MWPVCPGVFGNRRPLSNHHPVLGSDRVYDRVAGGHSLLSIQPYRLASLLPQFYQDHERLQLDADALIDRLITDCPELYPQCRYNPLKEDELREVYYSALRSLSRSSLSQVELDVTQAWLNKLEEYYRRDKTDARIINQLYLHRRSQHLFRALAEVAHTNRSSRLSRVLYNFFIRHASDIGSIESSATLGQWCWALLRGVPQPDERLQCLLKVLRQRPHLPHKLHQYGRKGQQLAQKIESIISSRTLGVANSFSPRERMFRRSNSEDLLRVDDWVNRRLRSRSSSRDRRQLGAGRIEELDGLEEDEIALESERRLMRQGIRGNQRLLQISLNPRLVNELGLNDSTELDGLHRFAFEDNLRDWVWDRPVDLDAYDRIQEL